MSDMFEGFDLDGRESFGVVWCPFRVYLIPQGSGCLCSATGLERCRVRSDSRGLWCRCWRPDGSFSHMQGVLF